MLRDTCSLNNQGVSSKLAEMYSDSRNIGVSRFTISLCLS